MSRRIFTAIRGATAWECQIGRLWFGLLYPRFWLYSRHRAAYIRASKPYNFLASRAWLYQWPVFVRWEPDD